MSDDFSRTLLQETAAERFVKAIYKEPQELSFDYNRIHEPLEDGYGKVTGEVTLYNGEKQGYVVVVGPDMTCISVKINEDSVYDKGEVNAENLGPEHKPASEIVLKSD